MMVDFRHQETVQTPHHRSDSMPARGSRHALQARQAGPNGHCGHGPACQAVAPDGEDATTWTHPHHPGLPICSRAVQALAQGMDRGLQRFTSAFRAASRSTRRMSPPPVVRLPLELDIGLLRQDDRLLGKGRGTTLVPGASSEVDLTWGRMLSMDYFIAALAAQCLLF